MEQTKIESLIETSTDMVAAFIISWMVMLWFIPMVYPNHASTVQSAFGVVFIFTHLTTLSGNLAERNFMPTLKSFPFLSFIVTISVISKP